MTIDYSLFIITVEREKSNFKKWNANMGSINPESRLYLEIIESLIPDIVFDTMMGIARDIQNRTED